MSDRKTSAVELHNTRTRPCTSSSALLAVKRQGEQDSQTQAAQSRLAPSLLFLALPLHPRATLHHLDPFLSPCFLLFLLPSPASPDFHNCPLTPSHCLLPGPNRNPPHKNARARAQTSKQAGRLHTGPGTRSRARLAALPRRRSAISRRRRREENK